MDVSFVLAAVIFTLLALVLATSLFTGTSGSSDYGRAAGSVTGKERSFPWSQNGHGPCVSPGRKKRGKAEFDWCEMSGSAHDHWDVVKNVQSEEDQLTSDLSRPPSSASSGRGSYINLSETELLRCAFPGSQTEGAAEGSEHSTDKLDPNSYRYLPGKSRSQHLQMMMSRDELEEEQRVQREQLAAIFQLLKNNKDTFGDVSQGDMEEQLKLYSI